MVQNGHIVGITGRRQELLTSFQKEIPGRTHVKRMDVILPQAMAQLKELIGEMGGVDIIVINSGVGFPNADLVWDKEKETIDVNVSGFAAMANVAFEYFSGQAGGQIVGISSIAALRGGSDSPAYNASKAFVSNYLEGLRRKAVKAGLSLTVTDIQPGFVDTALAQGEGMFWVASREEAAKQIFAAITKKKNHAYITRRWRLVAWLLKLLPGWMCNRA